MLSLAVAFGLVRVGLSLALRAEQPALHAFECLSVTNAGSFKHLLLGLL